MSDNKKTEILPGMKNMAEAPTGASVGEDNEPRDWTGTLVAERYKVLKKIAAGGMGDLYAVEHLALKKSFAMKFLSPEFSSDPLMVKRFKQEAASLSKLNHSHCVTITDFGQTQDNQLFLTMELLHGQPLSAIIKNSEIDVSRALDLLHQVLLGLQHAHGLGLVHRDIKPANIFLTDEQPPVLKLLDFGLSKLVLPPTDATEANESLTAAGVIMGTPEYMSPEQAMAGEVDVRSDLYASGILLFHLLTGHPPWESDNKVEVLSKHLTEIPPRLPSQYPRALNSIVQKALQKNKDNRYQTTDEFLLALKEVQDQISQSTHPSSGASIVSSESVIGSLVENVQNRVQDSPVYQKSLDVHKSRPFVFPVIGIIVLLAWFFFAGGDGPLSTSRLKKVPSSKAPQLKVQVQEQIDDLTKYVHRAPSRKQLLALRTFVREEPDVAEGHLLLGLGFSKLDRVAEALSEYRQSILLNDSFRGDPRLVEDIRRLIHKPRHQDIAIEFVGNYVGKPALPLLFGRLNETGSFTTRQNIQTVLRALDQEDELDWVKVYIKDLNMAPSCVIKKEIIERIVDLDDKRAVPHLQQARGKSSGFLGLSKANKCVDLELARAIKDLK